MVITCSVAAAAAAAAAAAGRPITIAVAFFVFVPPLSLFLSTYHFSRPLPTPSYTPSSRPSATTRTLYLFGPLDFARLEASSSPPSIIYRPGSRGDCYLATVNRDLPREILAIYERASERVSERTSERFRHAASRAIIERLVPLSLSFYVTLTSICAVSLPVLFTLLISREDVALVQARRRF